MKYKVGDIVVIRPDLEGGNDYDNVFFDAHMENYCSREAVVTGVNEYGHMTIDIDDGEWVWTESMLCGTKEEYETRNDWTKQFSLDMLDDIPQDLEVCVWVKTAKDATLLCQALQERGYRWDSGDNGTLVNAENTRWEDHGDATVYWIARHAVDWTSRGVATDATYGYDHIIKYTFQSVTLDDFETPDAGLLLM